MCPSATNSRAFPSTNPQQGRNSGVCAAGPRLPGVEKKKKNQHGRAEGRHDSRLASMFKQLQSSLYFLFTKCMLKCFSRHKSTNVTNQCFSSHTHFLHLRGQILSYKLYKLLCLCGCDPQVSSPVQRHVSSPGPGTGSMSMSIRHENDSSWSSCSHLQDNEDRTEDIMWTPGLQQ